MYLGNLIVRLPQPLQQQAPPIDNPSEPHVQRGDQRRDGGEEKDRGNCELDDVGDVAKVIFHRCWYSSPD